MLYLPPLSSNYRTSHLYNILSIRDVSDHCLSWIMVQASLLRSPAPSDNLPASKFPAPQ